MPSIMKTLNCISRCQALYRHGNPVGEGDLLPAHHAFVFYVCKNPGRTQDEIAREVCLNKSTVARTLTYLEERGYVERRTDERDKRCLRVYPTEKMSSELQGVREISAHWRDLILLDFSDEEKSLLESILLKMENNAREAAGVRRSEE